MPAAKINQLRVNERAASAALAKADRTPLCKQQATTPPTDVPQTTGTEKSTKQYEKAPKSVLDALGAPDRCWKPEDQQEIDRLTKEVAAADSEVKTYTSNLTNDTQKASVSGLDFYKKAVATDTKDLADATAKRDKLQKQLDALKALKPCPPEQRKAETPPPPPPPGDGKTGMIQPPPPAQYYCDNPAGYYPTVATCSVPWRQIPAAAPPAAAASPPAATETAAPSFVPSIGIGFGFGGGGGGRDNRNNNTPSRNRN